MKKLEDLYFNGNLNPGEQNVLRYFLFDCYTGLRYKDLKDLKYSDIKKGNYKGEEFEFIYIKQHKTTEPVSIPILDKARRFMPKRIVKNQNVFNVKSGNTSRRHLKAIAKKAGIEKNITMHTGRYTLGTTGLEYGLDLIYISRILGHTDVRITARIYTKTDIGMLYANIKKMDK